MLGIPGMRYFAELVAVTAIASLVSVVPAWARSVGSPEQSASIVKPAEIRSPALIGSSGIVRACENPICRSRGIYRLVVQSVSPNGNPLCPPLAGGGWGRFGRAPRSYPGGCELS